jgi:hypothetical protein
MKIEKIETSNTLEPGQLLATWNDWRWFTSDTFAFFEGGIRALQFYRHRGQPVPGTRRPKRRRNFRHPHTTNERRASLKVWGSAEAVNELTFYRVRLKRSANRLPNVYDDMFIRYQRTWKKHRQTQGKEINKINRQIHSPLFWDA